MINFLKYLIEGMVVSVVSSLNRRNTLVEMLLIGLTAAVVFMILDLFAPEIYHSTKRGTGFGFGFGMLSGNPSYKTAVSVPTTLQALQPSTTLSALPTLPALQASAPPMVPQMLGGNGLPKRYFGNSDNSVKEHFESQAQLDYVEQGVPKPYKWHNDNWATKTVQPGYNEDVVGYNENVIDKISVVEQEHKN